MPKRVPAPRVLLVTLAFLLSAAAAGRQKPGEKPPAADPLRRVLESRGYVAVPLIQEGDDGAFVVECRSGTETWRMLLDTGAEYSSLDAGLVKKLGLKSNGEVMAVGVEGTRKGIEVSLRGLSIGDYDTRAMANSLTFAVFDFSAMNAVNDQRKLGRIDGLLGHSALKHNSAVIDYTTRTLYLRTPLTGLWPEIEGRWVATGGQEDGRERRTDPANPPRLEFKDRRLHLTDGTKRYEFGMHVKPGKDRYALALFAPDKEWADTLSYTAGGLLKVSEDRLIVCLCLDPATAKGMPDEFKAPADSGRLLLEFRREK